MTPNDIIATLVKLVERVDTIMIHNSVQPPYITVKSEDFHAIHAVMLELGNLGSGPNGSWRPPQAVRNALSSFLHASTYAGTWALYDDNGQKPGEGVAHIAPPPVPPPPLAPPACLEMRLARQVDEQYLTANSGQWVCWFCSEHMPKDPDEPLSRLEEQHAEGCAVPMARQIIENNT